MSERDPRFPDRLQAYGFPTERQAVQSAREELGNKAKKGRAFVTSFENGQWGWLNVSNYDLRTALQSRS